MCKGKMKDDFVNFPVDNKHHFILIKEVPALVCEECGEFFIDDKVHTQIERIVNKTKEANAELEIVKFAA